MKITAHCFAYNVKIDPLPINFIFREYLVSLDHHKLEEKEGLMLKISKSIKPSELQVEGEIKDDQGLFIEKRMRPYKEALIEVSQLVEGILSIMYLSTPPKFDWDKTLVNVNAETLEEEELIKSGTITGGFGTVNNQPQYPLYAWNANVTATINRANNHIPALSFLSQAIRSQDRQDQEVAFFLYFRIIDGYFSDGDTHVERELLNKATELSKYIVYSMEIKNATKSILAELKLPSKSEKDFNGLISDIVLIRHKLTHFSETNAETHHRAGIIFELNILNFYLRKACILILRDNIGLDSKT